MMSMKIYEENEMVTLGMTLNNKDIYQNNNMAFHRSQNDKEIIANRKRIAQYLNVTLNDFVFANQTHRTNFYKVTHRDRSCGAFSKDTAIQNVDALYTRESNVVLCIFAADCVPVIFYNKNCGI